MPKIAILAIGDELLNGSLSDTNTAAIARILASDGFTLCQSRAVGDTVADIAEAVQQLADSHDVLITTGGLGPTVDDLTAEAVARACNTETELNQQAAELIDTYFKRLGRPKHQRNRKSAILPIGSAPLKNPRGTAPGFTIELSGCSIYSLPGVPDEMAKMVETAVLPKLTERFGKPHHTPERVLTLFGIPEPLIEEKLLQVGLPDGVDLAFGVAFPLVLVKLRSTQNNATELLDLAEQRVESTYPSEIVARGAESIAGATAALLLQSKQTLSLAESCTGGLIGKMLTDIPGSSGFLERGAITYSNNAKIDWLNVPEDVLEKEGAVSETVARLMAEGIRAATDTDYALAVTGIAGPDGGTDEKPVGTVFIARASRDESIVERYLFAGDRDRIRMRTACAALALLQHRLKAN